MTTHPGVLETPAGVRYTFDPGSFCLELLTTGGPGEYGRYEVLHRPSDLVSWLADSRLALDMPIAASDLRIRPADLRKVKQFRDMLWRVLPAFVRGERPSPADVAQINESVGPVPQVGLDASGRGRAWRPPITGGQVLGLAAREAVDLIGGPLTSRVRQCQGADCDLLFLDTSRPGNRRWCSMQRCGNRHKVGAYRSRRQER